MGRLFGTDGIRGTAGEPPLDAATTARIGAALAATISTAAGGPVRVLVGRDTRESGPAIEAALARGIRAAGGEVASAGVLPTPAIAYLTAHLGFTAGVVISASHNPYQDNGIKVFSAAGRKLEDDDEAAIERAVTAGGAVPAAAGAGAVPAVDGRDAYIAHLTAILDGAPPPGPLRVALDCANGATAAVAPRLFEALGLEHRVLAGAPDGRNINRECGSTAPAGLAAAVVEGGYDLGVAFDGDGDRAIFVDARGRVVDGDAVIYLCAKHLRAESALAGDGVVATVMSNIGLELALADLGLTLVRCPVGDRHVVQEMRRRGLVIGGEQSGHIVFAGDLWTGDGLGTALHVLRTMAATGRSLDALAGELVTYPQVLLNLRVAEKVDLATVPAVAAVIARVEETLAGHGRLLVRYSGTEPLLRVMLEGRDRGEIDRLGAEIIDAVRANVGTAPPATA
jgi:phosphoglucosamine mutase